MSNDADLEVEIQAKGLTAPRLTPTDIEAAIRSEYYFTADEPVNPGPCDVQALSCLTFCVLVLQNGYTVTGESACISPENFNVEIGRKVARQHAVDKIWTLEGYVLKEKLRRIKQ